MSLATKLWYRFELSDDPLFRSLLAVRFSGEISREWLPDEGQWQVTHEGFVGRHEVAVLAVLLMIANRLSGTDAPGGFTGFATNAAPRLEPK